MPIAVLTAYTETRVRTFRLVLSFLPCNTGFCVFLEYCLIHTRQTHSDFFLLVYNKKDDGGKFHKYIHMRLDDLFTVVDFRIKKLEVLDKRLSKLKKKDIETEDWK